jgi:hypothetical protein
MIAYGLLAMLSYLYSSFPLLSLWKGFEVLSISLVGMFIGTRLKKEADIQDAMNIIILALWFLVVSSLVGAAVVPSEAFTAMKARGPMAFSLEGVYPFVNANSLSQIAGMVSVIALVWMVKPGGKYGIIGPAVILLVSLACLLLSHSRTSIIALVVVAFPVLMVFRRRNLVIGALCVGVLLLVTDVVVEYFMPYFVRGQSVQVLTSLSGRTEFWPEVIKKVAEAPFLGHGFLCKPTDDMEYFERRQHVSGGNAGLGVTGLVLFCIPLFTIVYNLWKARPWKTGFDLSSDWRFLWVQLLAVFFFLFLRSLTGRHSRTSTLTLSSLSLCLSQRIACARWLCSKRNKTQGFRTMTDRGDPVLEMHADQAFRNSAMVGRYLSAFFERLNENRVCYCVLHSYEGLPAYAPSDVDMAVASGDLRKTEAVLFEVSDLLGFKVIQKLYYDIPRCYYYVIFFRDEVGSPGFVQLDFLNDDYGIGHYFMNTRSLLEGRRQYNGFYVPSVPVEACYLLIKKVIKGSFLSRARGKTESAF